MKVDHLLIFAYDDSPLDEENERWSGTPDPGPQPAFQPDKIEVCACRKHPSGKLMDPNPNCMNCRGTGEAITGEVYDTVFDGTGKFTQRERKQNDDPGDSSQLVRFR